jgi:hypothetical protein
MLRGLASSARHNALAYGYSLTTTAAFGVLVALDHQPDILDVFLFAVGGTVTFIIATASITRGFRIGHDEEPRVVQALGASLGLFSVLGGLGAATLVGGATTGWVAWFLGPFAASSVYLLLSAIELVAARKISERAELELAKPDD